MPISLGNNYGFMLKMWCFKVRQLSTFGTQFLGTGGGRKMDTMRSLVYLVGF